MAWNVPRRVVPGYVLVRWHISRFPPFHWYLRFLHALRGPSNSGSRGCAVRNLFRWTFRAILSLSVVCCVESSAWARPIVKPVWSSERRGYGFDESIILDWGRDVSRNGDTTAVRYSNLWFNTLRNNQSLKSRIDWKIVILFPCVGFQQAYLFNCSWWVKPIQDYWTYINKFFLRK